MERPNCSFSELVVSICFTSKEKNDVYIYTRKKGNLSSMAKGIVYKKKACFLE